MPSPGLVRRVEILEGKVLTLADLPDRMAALELQIVQFRVEFHAEFSAFRQELGQQLRQEFRLEIATLATKAELGQAIATLATKAEFGQAIATLATKAELGQAVATLATRADLEQLRAEMVEGNEETRRFMRVLHEEVLSRMVQLGESRPARPRSTGPRRKQ